MILITGAAGKTGLSIIRALSKSNHAVRALVRRDEQLEQVKISGASESIAGDMEDEGILIEAMEGIQQVYHICPNVHPEELSIGRKAMTAARRGGVEHFVYHSVLHPQAEKMPHHWAKMRVEEELFESKLSFTILQPAPYMQNILAGWVEIRAQKRYLIPYDPNTRITMVDLEDVALAAFTVLTSAGHLNAVYELCGAKNISQAQVAEILSRKLGDDVQLHVMDRQDWERRAYERGLGEYQVETLLSMFDYYERYGFSGSANVLRWLLGREPTTFSEFLDRVIAADVG